MNTNNLIYKFVAQLCEKQYAYAHSTLTSIVEAKVKDKIKKEVAKKENKKQMLSKKNNKKSKMGNKKNK